MAWLPRFQICLLIHLTLCQSRHYNFLKKQSCRTPDLVERTEMVSQKDLEQSDLVPAWRMKGISGLVECLIRGPSDIYLSPTIMSIPTDNAHSLALMPNPLMIPEKGNYVVKCTKLYELEVDFDFRWKKPLQGPKFLDHQISSKSQDETPHKCIKILSLIDKINEAALSDHLQTVVKGECPGIVIESSLENYLNSDQIYHGPPAVIRVHNNKKTAAKFGKDGEDASILPLCTTRDVPGRWLPIKMARPLVLNGESIPKKRTKYWVPYSCRPTYWTANALLNVSRLGAESPFSCDLKSLNKIVFTGSSTESVLFSSFREYMLGESSSKAKRNKERDHIREKRQELLASTSLKLSPTLTMQFELFPQMMPLTFQRNESLVNHDFLTQVESILALKPSAIVMHIGVHELCGAYGPDWFSKDREHAPCATRNDLRNAYQRYIMLLKQSGYTGKLVFRSMMGTFPDPFFRWNGFVNCNTGRLFGTEREFKNPCIRVAAPLAHAAALGQDLAVWKQHNIPIVNAYDVVHSSPTSVEALPDGLHPEVSSDESLAINQLILNNLCGTFENERSNFDIEQLEPKSKSNKDIANSFSIVPRPSPEDVDRESIFFGRK